MRKLKPVLIVVVLLYSIWLLDYAIEPIFGVKLNSFGLIPRTQIGLIGIFTSPFLHADIYHLASNSIPLVIMLSTLLLFYETKVLKVVVGVTLFSGILLWFSVVKPITL